MKSWGLALALAVAAGCDSSHSARMETPDMATGDLAVVVGDLSVVDGAPADSAPAPTPPPDLDTSPVDLGAVACSASAPLVPAVGPHSAGHRIRLCQRVRGVG